MRGTAGGVWDPTAPSARVLHSDAAGCPVDCRRSAVAYEDGSNDDDESNDREENAVFGHRLAGLESCPDSQLGKQGAKVCHGQIIGAPLFRL